ncbi:MAG: hypothetical protein HXY24_13025 [Rubrivivax sp.]|nr:hypothetical protein [Rubrivivax sp.]
MAVFPSLPQLAAALALGVCSAAAAVETVKAALAYKVDWPGHGITAMLEYGSLENDQMQPVCAGKLSIENYGSRSYAVLFFNVAIFSASRELIATDRFSLTSNLKPGGKAEIPFDPRNPLNPVVLTESYRECPREMHSARVILDGF